MAVVVSADSTTQVVVVTAQQTYVPIQSAQLSPGKWSGILSPFTYIGVLAVAAGTTLLPIDASYTISSVRARVSAAPVGNSIIIDVNKNGTTIFTTQGNRPTIPAGQTDSGAGATPNVVTLSAGDYLSVDIDQVGSTPGSNLVVAVYASRSLG